MYIIDVVALVWFVVAITTIIIGSNTNNETVIVSGLIILVSLLFMSGAFKVGAAWQSIDIKEKYILIEKKKISNEIQNSTNK